MTHVQEESMAAKLVIFTDLDATLLDRESYSWEPAREALDRLRGSGASLVMVSSKTFSEMRSLYAELGFTDPFIIENGGAIIFDSDLWTALRINPTIGSSPHQINQRFISMPLGRPYSQLVEQLGFLSRLARVKTRGFSSMSLEEITSLTGLPPDKAQLCRIRDYDEPFLLHGDRNDTERLLEIANQANLQMEQGGRFWHLFSHKGKGEAVSRLIDIYAGRYDRIYCVGLGDSPNDLSFLQLMNLAFLLGQPSEQELILEGNRKLRCCVDVGPGAWNSRIIEFLSNRKEFS